MKVKAGDKVRIYRGTLLRRVGTGYINAKKTFVVTIADVHETKEPTYFSDGFLRSPGRPAEVVWKSGTTWTYARAYDVELVKD